MLEIFAIILSLILIAKLIEDMTKIPFVLIVIVLSYVANHFFDLSILGNNFEEIMYLMLPVILIPDVLGLSRSELKEHFSDIFYLAVVAVILSIVLAVGVTYLVQGSYRFSVFELMILFTPLMATDVVSVGAIFSKFSLPEKLKLYAEGESLFNDITAMIIFFFIAMPFLQGETISLATLAGTTLYTIAVSFLIGVGMGLLGYHGFKFFKDSFEKFIAIYVMASVGFLVADRLHLSGILAVVVSVMVFKYLFDKEGDYRHKNISSVVSYLNRPGCSVLTFRAYKKEAFYLGLFANAVIFISMAHVIDLELLYSYRMEILYAFILTTLIRYFVVYLLKRHRKLPWRWNNILTLSGMKGGLALIMIVSLDDSFRYKEMFLAIVFGVVILSIFIYTFTLMLYLHFQKENMLIDKAAEHQIMLKDVKELLKKEEESGAYNEIMFEELIEKEIQRAEKQGYQFSLVAFQTDAATLKKIEHHFHPQGDYLGRIDAQTYSILLTHDSIEESIKFARKLKKLLGHTHIGIAQYMPGDSLEMIYDKLHTAIHSEKKIDIEV